MKELFLKALSSVNPVTTGRVPIVSGEGLDACYVDYGHRNTSVRDEAEEGVYLLKIAHALQSSSMRNIRFLCEPVQCIIIDRRTFRSGDHSYGPLAPIWMHVLRVDWPDSLKTLVLNGCMSAGDWCALAPMIIRKMRTVVALKAFLRERIVDYVPLCLIELQNECLAGLNIKGAMNDTLRHIKLSANYGESTNAACGAAVLLPRLARALQVASGNCKSLQTLVLELYSNDARFSMLSMSRHSEAVGNSWVICVRVMDVNLFVPMRKLLYEAVDEKFITKFQVPAQLITYQFLQRSGSRADTTLRMVFLTGVTPFNFISEQLPVVFYPEVRFICLSCTAPYARGSWGMVGAQKGYEMNLFPHAVNCVLLEEEYSPPMSAVDGHKSSTHASETSVIVALRETAPFLKNFIVEVNIDPWSGRLDRRHIYLVKELLKLWSIDNLILYNRQSCISRFRPVSVGSSGETDLDVCLRSTKPEPYIHRELNMVLNSSVRTFSGSAWSDLGIQCFPSTSNEIEKFWGEIYPNIPL